MGGAIDFAVRFRCQKVFVREPPTFGKHEDILHRKFSAAG